MAYADGSPRKSTCAYDVVIRQNAIPGYVDPDGVNLERDLQVVVGIDWHWVQAMDQSGSWISYPYNRSARAAISLFVEVAPIRDSRVCRDLDVLSGRGGTHQLLAGLRALVRNLVPARVADCAASVNAVVPAPT